MSDESSPSLRPVQHVGEVPSLRLAIKSFSIEGEVILEDLDIALRGGEAVALTGSIGSGKSTILGLAAGLWPKYLQGSLEGARICGWDRGETRIGHLFQDPDANFCATGVAEEIQYAVEIRDESRDVALARYKRVVSEFGLEEVLRKPLRELSVGWRQWVAISACLAQDPDILIWDEPTAHLDVSRRGILVRKLTSWLRESPTRAILAATHDLGLVEGVGARTIELTPSHVREARGACFIGEKATKGRPETPLVALRNVSFGYRRSQPLFKDLSLSIFPGECIGIVGKNGTGKSTLARVIAGVQKPLSGAIEWCGQRRQTGLSVGYVAQLATTQLFKSTVKDELELTPRIVGKATDSARTLKKFLPEIPVHRDPWLLSYGQQRVLQVAAFDDVPNVMVIDEPPAENGCHRAPAIAGFVTEFLQRGGAIVIVTHDLADWKQVVTRVVNLDDLGDQAFQRAGPADSPAAGAALNEERPIRAGDPGILAKVAVLGVATAGIVAPVSLLPWFIASTLVLIGLRSVGWLGSGLLWGAPAVIAVLGGVIAYGAGYPLEVVGQHAAEAGARMLVACASGVIFMLYLTERDLGHLFCRFRAPALAIAITAAYKSVPLVMFNTRELLMNAKARGLMLRRRVFRLAFDVGSLTATSVLLLLSAASNLAVLFELRGITHPGAILFKEEARLFTLGLWVWAAFSTGLLVLAGVG